MIKQLEQVMHMAATLNHTTGLALFPDLGMRLTTDL